MPIIANSDLKTWLGITDSTDDATITLAVDAVNQWVVEHCGRDFEKVATGSASARHYRPSSPTVVTTHDFWETSVLVVKTDTGDDGTYETTWTINTDFVVEPTDGLVAGQTRPYYRLRAVGAKTFPSAKRPSVEVTAAWGWTAVPAAVKTATLIQAGRVFKRKHSPEGVLGGWSEFGAVRVGSRLDPDVQAALGPFRRPEIAALVA